ncbi:hypothetical protein LSH36_269g00030 [Paralvinella palmiformis]|uniref:TMC domain-containing protein n=1 Tax=Paralvinella palmiformis TaxID=53620 RepID=A0AAD9JJY6_9ANNE|nr:hypothetical protein LSH36_269g00030 [Paralvinella palmiformis]
MEERETGSPSLGSRQKTNWSWIGDTLQDEYYLSRKTDRENTALPPITGRAANDRWRGATKTILALLPSRRIHRYMTPAASMALDNKQLGAGRRRDTDAVMEQFMNTKHLKVDYDNDGNYDEMDRIKQLNIIKMMSVSIEMKRKLRARLFEKMPKVSSKSCAAYFHHQRMKLYRFRVRSKRRFNETKEALTLWGGAFKNIEGHFGSGVVSYFTFLKHLFLTNLLLALIMILFVVIPMAIFPETEYNDILVGSDASTSEAVSLAVNCTLQYNVNKTGQWYEYIINVLQGTGFMEKTVLFYGYYSDKEIDFTSLTYNYNMPFAYVTSINVVFVVSLAIMVVLSAKGFRERLLSEGQSVKKYFTKTFLAWDYSQNDERTTNIQHKSVYRDIAGSLEHDRADSRRKSRSRNESCRIWTVRILINILVLAFLGGAGYLIYFTTVKTIELTKGDAWSSYHLIIQFLVQYMTSVTITLLNIIIPMIFNKLIAFEDYSTAVTINFRRSGLYSCGSLRWQLSCFLYMSVLPAIQKITAMWEPESAPRSTLIVVKCPCKVSRLIGLQEFDISKNVLDLVYMETLMWLGVLFCPLLPAITVVKNFIVFYLKMLTTLQNYTPSSTTYHASDSEHFFQILLLTSFFGCLVPGLYVMWQLVIHYLAVSNKAYKEMVKMMRIHLQLESQDKQFLLSQVVGSGDNKQKTIKKRVTVDVEAQKSTSHMANLPGEVSTSGDNDDIWG